MDVFGPESDALFTPWGSSGKPDVITETSPKPDLLPDAWAPKIKNDKTHAQQISDQKETIDMLIEKTDNLSKVINEMMTVHGLIQFNRS